MSSIQAMPAPQQGLGLSAVARRPTPPTVSPVDLVFSCSICQKLLRDAIDEATAAPDFNCRRVDGAVEFVPMWLTSCGHVICSHHFVGGGVSFHPVDTYPNASCLYCAEHHQDHEMKALWRLRGLAPEKCDEGIKAAYFEVPALLYKFYNQARAEANRFQMLALIGFATGACKRLTVFDKVFPDFDRFRRKKNKVMHTLKQAPKLRKENEILRQKLHDLGYIIPTDLEHADDIYQGEDEEYFMT